jgi:hypothetical protein
LKRDHLPDLPTVHSNPHCVYLTDTYAAYFAMSATGENENPAIIEIDTDKLDTIFMRPDEDYLEQSTRNVDPRRLPERFHGGMKVPGRGFKHMVWTNTLWFRDNLWKFADLWQDSLRRLGNCCYEGIIPAEAITRVTTWNIAAQTAASVLAMDAQVTLMSRNLCARPHQAVIRHFLGDPVTPADFDHQPAFRDLPMPDAMRPLYEEKDAQLQKMIDNRTGIRIYRRLEDGSITWSQVDADPIVLQTTVTGRIKCDAPEPQSPNVQAATPEQRKMLQADKVFTEVDYSEVERQVAKAYGLPIETLQQEPSNHAQAKSDERVAEDHNNKTL